MVESFRIAITSLLTNRTRALLTTLGIVIGVAAVIALVSLGRGVEVYIASQFDDLGADILTITSRDPQTDTRDYVAPLTNEEAEAIGNALVAPHVADVLMQYNVRGDVSANGESLTLNANGVTANYPSLNNWAVGQGAFFTDEQVAGDERVIVLGTSVVEELFGFGVDPIGLSVDFNGLAFEVIGVMEEQSAQGFQDPNEVVYVPLSVAQTRLDNARVRGGTYGLSRIQVRATSAEDVLLAEQEITTYLTEAHEIEFEGDEDFDVADAGSVGDSLDEITGILTIFLGLIAGISLLVGGIGIMNIMLVSVSERTREIGLRKAVGAQRMDILSQFLVESVLLSIAGGVVGVFAGWAVIEIAAGFLPDLVLELSTDAIALAVGVSSFIGVFFGAYPANRAAVMRPIDALRAE